MPALPRRATVPAIDRGGEMISSRTAPDLICADVLICAYS